MSTTSYHSTYRKEEGKRRKRCLACERQLRDGERIIVRKIIGVMRNNESLFHIECHALVLEQERRRSEPFYLYG